MRHAPRQVLTVLTSEEVRQDGLTRLPHISNNHPADIPHRQQGWLPTVRPQHQADHLSRVCHAGEIVAMWSRERSLQPRTRPRRIAIDWDILRQFARGLAAADPGAPRARLDSPNIILDGEIGDEAATRCDLAEAAQVSA